MLNLIGVIIAFAVIIYLIRKKLNFGLSLIFGSIIVGLFSLQEISPVDIPKSFIEATIYSFEDQTINFQTIELAILLTLIYILAKAMQETDAINKMINSLRTLFYRGGTLGIIPAVYGLMPVPGGALFSAPMIDKEGEKYKLRQDQKNFLNVWFRHIWFPIFPVSSAMLLIISYDFSNINIYELIIADLPAFIAFILIGLIYLKLFIKNSYEPIKKPKKDYKGLVYLLPPILPIIIYVLFFIAFILAGFQNIKDFQRIIFIIGVILSLITLYYLLDIQWKEYLNILKKSVSFNLALAIFGIMIFREIIETSRSNEILAHVLGGLPFPALIIVLIAPFFLGLITGYNFGAIALSYFLVEPFFRYTGINIVGVTSLVFISSLLGYLISPIHLCNVVSSEYLKTDVTRIYKMYLPAVALLLLIQVVFIIVFYRV